MDYELKEYPEVHRVNTPRRTIGQRRGIENSSRLRRPRQHLKTTFRIDNKNPGPPMHPAAMGPPGPKQKVQKKRQLSF